MADKSFTFIFHKSLTFIFHGWGGWEVWRSVLPERWQARTVGRRWLRSLTQHGQNPIDLEQTAVLLRMPRQTWRVVDAKGRVEPAASDMPPGLV